MLDRFKELLGMKHEFVECTTEEDSFKLFSDLESGLNVHSREQKIEKALKSLKTQNAEGIHAGMLLARHGFQRAVERYIHFLLKLYRAGAEAKQIIEVLKIQDKDGWTFGMDIAQLYTQDTSIVLSYLALLKLIKDEGKSIQMDDLFALMQLKGKSYLSDQSKWTFAQIVSNCQEIAVVFQLIAGGLLPEDEYKKLIVRREAIASYILKHENLFFKKIMLREAADSEHPLAKFFSVKEGIRPMPFVDLNKKMQEELAKVERNDRIRWQAQFFKEGVIKEDEDVNNCLALHDPFEPYDVSQGERLCAENASPVTAQPMDRKAH